MGGEGKREERWSRSEGVGGEHHNSTRCIRVTIRMIPRYHSYSRTRYLLLPCGIDLFLNKHLVCSRSRVLWAHVQYFGLLSIHEVYFTADRLCGPTALLMNTSSRVTYEAPLVY